MIVFPHAKINLGLSVISRRADGFHNLETIFYPLPICDVLEIVPSKETHLVASGLAIPGLPSNNLVIRVHQLLKTNYQQVGDLAIHLHKTIPTGAGMGGGSSDAMAILLAMDSYFHLNISPEDLKAYALELGSDCPFFLQRFPCFASGRGEILEPLRLDLSGYSLLLIHPEIHMETSRAFTRIHPRKPVFPLKKSILLPITEWKDVIQNDFEIPVFEEYPSLRMIKEKLYHAGALYAAMTGSGSTIYGIFKKSGIPPISVEHAVQTPIP
jgi:4-diphosphocytidyl-2-C-methyl-D-erythritol kinase